MKEDRLDGNIDHFMDVNQSFLIKLSSWYTCCKFVLLFKIILNRVLVLDKSKYTYVQVRQWKKERKYLILKIKGRSRKMENSYDKYY